MNDTHIRDNARLFVLYGWIETSTAHAYTTPMFWGTMAECEKRRLESNFPGSLKVCRWDLLPPSY